MTAVPAIFNRLHLRQRQIRSAPDFSHFRFLHDWCEKELNDRLALIKRSFPTTVILNDRTSERFRENLKAAKGIETLISVLPDAKLKQHGQSVVLSDSESLPLSPASADLIVSILDLHRINDLPGTLIQIRQALKPDGLFVACMAGGETLHELRQVLIEAELKIRGGASPRVFPFADKQQMGALLQRAGFALPVVDSDILHISYRDLFHLMDDLRGMAGSNVIAARIKSMTPRRFFVEAAQTYARLFPDASGKISASCEIISLIGWAPHASQPKALRPGSAQARLADALGTEEIKTN